MWGRFKGGGKVVEEIDIANLYNTIIKFYKGSTALGHSLSKHAGRKSEIWGRLAGNSSKWHNQAIKHFEEIMNSPVDFIKVSVPNNPGRYFFEKVLPDGRGIRLNMDSSFKGFID